MNIFRVDCLELTILHQKRNALGRTRSVPWWPISFYPFVVIMVRDRVSNHKPHDCFLNRLFRRRSKKTSKLRVTGLCEGNSPGTGAFPAQMTSNAENVSIWWHHHVRRIYGSFSGMQYGFKCTISVMVSVRNTNVFPLHFVKETRAFKG